MFAGWPLGWIERKELENLGGVAQVTYLLKDACGVRRFAASPVVRVADTIVLVLLSASESLERDVVEVTHARGLVVVEVDLVWLLTPRTAVG